MSNNIKDFAVPFPLTGKNDKILTEDLSMYHVQSCCSLTSIDSYCSLSSFESSTVAQKDYHMNQCNKIQSIDGILNKENKEPCDTQEYSDLSGYLVANEDEDDKELERLYEAHSSGEISLDRKSEDLSSTDDQDRSMNIFTNKTIRKRKKPFRRVEQNFDPEHLQNDDDDGLYQSKRTLLPFTKRKTDALDMKYQRRKVPKQEKRCKTRKDTSQLIYSSSDPITDSSTDSSLSDNEGRNKREEISEFIGMPEFLDSVTKENKERNPVSKELTLTRPIKETQEAYETSGQILLPSDNSKHQSVSDSLSLSSNTTDECRGFNPAVDIFLQQSSNNTKLNIQDTFCIPKLDSNLLFGGNPQGGKFGKQAGHDATLMTTSFTQDTRKSLGSKIDISLNGHTQAKRNVSNQIDIVPIFSGSPLPQISILHDCLQNSTANIREPFDEPDRRKTNRISQQNVTEANPIEMKTSLGYDFFVNQQHRNNKNNHKKKTLTKSSYPPLPKYKKSIPPIPNDTSYLPPMRPPPRQPISTNSSTIDCPEIRNYICKEVVGEGSYGLVYKAVDNRTKNIVAMKQIPITNKDEGIPCTAMREISILRNCCHPNIISISDVIYSDTQFSTSERKCSICTKNLPNVNNDEPSLPYNLCRHCSLGQNRIYEANQSLKSSHLYLVLEYVPLDLKKYMDHIMPTQINSRLLRYLMYQLLTGVEYCHSKRILHRDLKPQNLLLDPTTMTLKIADFGLSRVCNPQLRSYTNEVVTLWYRCPELLLGINKYSYPIDIWSIATIFVELSNHRPLFPGDSEIDQLFRIFQKLGTPNEETWHGVTSFRYYLSNFPSWKTQDMHMIAPDLDPNGVELLQNILRYEPNKRFTCTEALQCSYFHDIETISKEFSFSVDCAKYY